MNVLAPTANGYCRSEAIVVVFLQKSKDAKRVYANLVHAKTNCDGYKEQGITYPSGQMQQRLLEEFYQECGVDPRTLGFVEAHGTGTKVSTFTRILIQILVSKSRSHDVSHLLLAFKLFLRIAAF